MTVAMDDLDRIMTIMAVAFDPRFGEAWSRRQVEDSLIVGNCHYGLIDRRGALFPSDDEAAGFWLSRHTFGEEELLLFAVSPTYRRKGLGGKLLSDLIRAAGTRGARRLLLEMRQGNPAEHLYSAFGFLPIGNRANYYHVADGTRIDAITFARTIE